MGAGKQNISHRNLTRFYQVPPKSLVKRVIDSKNQWSTMSPFDDSAFEKPLDASGLKSMQHYWHSSTHNIYILVSCIIWCPTVKEYRTRRSSSFPFLLSSKNMWPFYFNTRLLPPFEFLVNLENQPHDKCCDNRCDQKRKDCGF